MNHSNHFSYCEDTKSDASFPDDGIPPHHFHLGQGVYVAVTYFSTSVQVHLRHYKRDGNNRLFPTKRGVCLSPMLWQSFVNEIEQISTSYSVEETILKKDSLMIPAVFIENIPNIILQRYFKKTDCLPSGIFLRLELIIKIRIGDFCRTPRLVTIFDCLQSGAVINPLNLFENIQTSSF
ncbi:PC4 domain-containing protein [Trichonephila clavipes]|nr:PC4 domain-containing protein [Trichonephila clavipes]